jgi:signal transduction histidine kinase
MSCVATGAPYRVEVRAFHAADRKYRWCVSTALPLLNKEGRIVKWHGTIVDMHDWKLAQEELRNTQAELAHMMRVMTAGELTASIAHKVNQPLSGIIGIHERVCNIGSGIYAEWFRQNRTQETR